MTLRMFGRPARVSSEASQSRDGSVDVAVRTVIAIAAIVFWLIVTSWRPWELFERGGYSADFYDEQARSLLRLRLAVRPEIPGPEGFLIDGKTYLYYGPFLAIVRLPFALLGDVFFGRLVRVSMLVALMVLGHWAARLARAGRSVVRSRITDEPGDRWPIVLFTAAVVFSPALFASGWTSVYHETELWALTLAVIAVALLAEWAATGFTDRRRLAWAIAAIVATTLTRAPIGLGAAFGLGCIGLVLLWTTRGSPGDSRRTTGLIAAGGGIAALCANAAFNVAKFGSFFSVPGDRQVLSITDPTRAAFFEATGGSFFNVRFLPTTIVQYLRPDTISFERLVPGIRFGRLARNYGSLDVETVTPASSLIASATLILALAVVGAVWLARHRARTWSLLVIAGTIGALPTFMIGFIANRYLIDMLPPLIVAGAAGVWVVDRWPRPTVWRAAACALAVWGLWVNAALATWTLELKSPGFTELRSDVDDLLFGGGDVGIVDAGAGPVPRDGLVGIVDPCQAVYIAEQRRWVALERADGRFRVTGRVERLDEPSIRVAQTVAWTIDLEIVPDAEPATQVGVGDGQPLQFVYRTDVDPEGYRIDAPDGLPLDYEIVADPVNGDSLIVVDGVAALLPGDAPDSVDSAGIAPGRPGSGELAESPLCSKLAGRR